MKRVIVVLMVVLALVIGSVAVASAAGTTQVITITATPTYVSMAFTFNDAHDSSWAVGTVAASTNGYWWDDEGEAQVAAADPVVFADCAGNITNDGSVAMDVDCKGTNFTGGVGWTLAGAVAEDTVVLKSLNEGDANEAAYLTLTTGDVEDISNLAAAAYKGVDLHLETGTFTDGVAKSGSVTWTARAVT